MATFFDAINRFGSSDEKLVVLIGELKKMLPGAVNESGIIIALEGASIGWLLFYLSLFGLFYLFSSPFIGARELKDNIPFYASFCMLLYLWLTLAVLYHLPLMEHTIGFKLNEPVSMFLPLQIATMAPLLFWDAFLWLYRKYVRRDRVKFKIALVRSIVEISISSSLVSLACCALYANYGDTFIQQKGMCYCVLFCSFYILQHRK